VELQVGVTLNGLGLGYGRVMMESPPEAVKARTPEGPSKTVISHALELVEAPSFIVSIRVPLLVSRPSYFNF
jgi:hypothetical protein